MRVTVMNSGHDAAVNAAFNEILSDGFSPGRFDYRAPGRCTMASLDKYSDAVDCDGPAADVAHRHDFLSTVSRLPHAEIAARRDLGLAHTIEAEIIPRLMLAHTSKPSRRRSHRADGPTLSAADVERFSTIICAADLDDARRFIADLRTREISIEIIMLDLLAPTARLLGEMWEEDDADFAFVTIALCCLQQVLRDISGTFQIARPSNREAYRALLAPAPGEQHIFSLLMVDEFFRRANWDVWTMPAATEAELVDLLRREHFDMAGLSITCDQWLPQLRALITRMRAASRNKNLVIMVGGRPFVDSPGLVETLGADATATDGLNAVEAARNAVLSTAKVQSGLSLMSNAIA